MNFLRAASQRLRTRLVGSKLFGEPLSYCQFGDSSQVALLKNNFGTIARCERALDIFFHFDNLEGCTSSDLALGDDVEFSVIRDDKSKKPAAVRYGSVPGRPCEHFLKCMRKLYILSTSWCPAIKVQLCTIFG